MEILTQENFNEEIKTGIVIVDFYADWCGPCKQLAPFLDKLSKENTNIKFVKVDTEESQELSSLYNIRALPTIVFFKNGKEEERNVGFSPATVVNTLRKVIG